MNTENQDIEAGSEKQKQQVIEPVAVEKSELVYVTSIHMPTMTFFAQLCKESMEDLIKLDEEVNDYCEQNKEQPLNKIRPGDYVCAKYTNGFWYRSLVLERCRATQTYSVQMIDYGNFQITDREDIITVDLDQLAWFKRPSFGITCRIEDIWKVPEEEANRALNCLHNNYLLINLRGQETGLQYLVDIPRVGYNMPFWDKFHPQSTQLLHAKQERRAVRANQAVDEAASSLDEESTSEEPSVSSGLVVFPGL